MLFGRRNNVIRQFAIWDQFNNMSSFLRINYKISCFKCNYNLIKNYEISKIEFWIATSLGYKNHLKLLTSEKIRANVCCKHKGSCWKGRVPKCQLVLSGWKLVPLFECRQRSIAGVPNLSGAEHRGAVEMCLRCSYF